MKLHKWFSIFLACAPLVMVAAESTPNATVVSVTGTVVLAGPDGATLNTAVGTVLPEGSVVTTSPGGQVTIKLFDGTTTIVQPDSHVIISTHKTVSESDGLKEETLLDLKAGGVVNTLDPAKKLVTRFRVRTARGVAAARGTVFAVRINTEQTSSDVVTMSGTVTFTTDQGDFSVGIGQYSSGNGVESVAQAVQNNPGLAAQILTATAQVAAQVGTGTITNTADSPNLTTAVLASLVEVAVEASPTTAADTVKTLIQLAGNNLTSAQISAITQAAIQAAPAQATAIQDGANQAAAAQNKTATSGNATTVLPPLDQTQITVSPSGQP